MKQLTQLDELQKPREGFVMRNPLNDAEVKCTAQFVEQWRKRGFEIFSKGTIQLISE
ncbi:hypothetical protein D3C81_1929390 [compost metagenome]